MDGSLAAADRSLRTFMCRPFDEGDAETNFKKASAPVERFRNALRAGAGAGEKRKGLRMGAQILNAEAGLMTIRLSGRLSYSELVAAQKEAAEILKKQGKMRVLIVGGGFAGWEKEGDWGNLSFQNENDRYIERIALVGDRQWETLALLFAGQGVRQVPVAFFEAADLAKARLWLASGE